MERILWEVLCCEEADSVAFTYMGLKGGKPITYTQKLRV